MDKRVGYGQQAGESCTVVAGSGCEQAVAFLDGLKICFERKDGVEMRGEHDDRTGALGRKTGGRQNADHVADGVDLDASKAGGSELPAEPLGALLLAVEWRGDGDTLGLPVHDFLRIGMEPGKRA